MSDRAIVVLVLGAVALFAVTGPVAYKLTPSRDPLPPSPVVVPVASEPELVVVTDESGKRIDDKAVETAASKLVLGTWHVQAIPKPGDTGWTRTIYVTDGVLPPKPPVPPTPVPVPPTPVPPLPPPLPPVVEGKRALLIVHEASQPHLEFSQLITNLQAGEQSKYLASKGHTVSILDTDSKGPDGSPSKNLEAWRPFFSGLTLPALFIIDPATKTIVHKESLPQTATADSVLATLKANGG